MRAFDSSKLPKLSKENYGSVKEITKPIVLDIGCGTGHSSLYLANKNPNSIIIGIERTKEKFSKFKRNIKGIENIIAINEDAIPFITQFINISSVDAVYILYPNPYPKAKQSNKRFHNMPFMSELLRKMKPGGSLTQATNILSYHKESLDMFTNTWELHLESNKVVEPGTKRTLFEKKYLERSEKCYELVLLK